MKQLENIIALTICLVFGTLGVFLVNTEGGARAEHQAEIHFLNVGQGDAILLERDEGQTLIDVGPDTAILSELSKVMSYSDKKIEAVVITHPHADHLGGLHSILQAYDVEKIYFNGISYSSPQFEDFLSSVRIRKIPIERLYAGKKIQIKGMNLNVLWPPETLPKTNDLNETSLVMEAQVDNARILLAGDASAQILNNLDLASADILKVSHHGSKTGTDRQLLNKINPRYAIIQVGRNSYGHPSPSILTLLSNIRTLRTDRDGTTSFWTDNAGVFLY